MKSKTLSQVNDTRLDREIQDEKSKHHKGLYRLSVNHESCGNTVSSGRQEPPEHPKVEGFSDGGSLTTEWLTTEEAAKYLKVSVPSLRNMTSNGKVPYYKFERRNRYRLDDLRKLLLKNPRGGFYGN